MMKRWVLPLAFATAGCDAWGEVICDHEEVPGIVIVVVDSVTGERPQDEAIRVVATAGEFADTAGRIRGGNARLAGERPGTYRVDVRAEGYEPWRALGVEVLDDVCHVRTVTDTARLQPERR
jgi:hypothetical protein